MLSNPRDYTAEFLLCPQLLSNTVIYFRIIEGSNIPVRLGFFLIKGLGKLSDISLHMLSFVLCYLAI